MQKEKKVRAYTRKTKSGKTVSVKAHTAKYDAAEEARKAFAKKAGAGDELVKTKEVVKEKVEDNGLGFTADEYKAWYHWDMVDDPKNPKALKVKKALLASMGPRAYKKYEDQMSESYSSRGDKKAFGALPELVSARTEARNARSFEKLHKGQKALAENLGAKDAAAKFDSMAKEQGAKRKAAEKKLKGSNTAKDAPELERRDIGKGRAFKNNKEGIAWAKENGEPIKTFMGTVYKVGDVLYGNVSPGHGGTAWGKISPSFARDYLKHNAYQDQKKEWRKNPPIPTDAAARTRLYKLLTSDTPYYELPDKWRLGLYTPYGNLSPKGKAFIKEYEESRASNKKSSEKKSSTGVPESASSRTRLYNLLNEGKFDKVPSKYRHLVSDDGSLSDEGRAFTRAYRQELKRSRSPRAKRATPISTTLNSFSAYEKAVKSGDARYKTAIKNFERDMDKKYGKGKW